MKMLSKLSLISTAAVCFVLAGCASNPYQSGNKQLAFNGKTTVTSNIDNLCTSTSGQYALKVTQRWVGGLTGQVMMKCKPNFTVKYSPSYQLYFDVIQNAPGNKVVGACPVKLVSAAKGTAISKVKLVFSNTSGVPDCEALVSH